MSMQEARRLLDDLAANEGLLATFQEMEGDAVEARAHGLGYDVALDDIVQAVADRRATTSDEPVELDESELDSVVGGWEDAPDGHEMGCFLFWHGKSWQRENEVWCKRDFYCYTNWDGCICMGRGSSRG